MKNILLYGIIGFGAYYAWNQYEISRKRKWLKDYAGNDTFFNGVVDRMSDDEIVYVYEYLTKYAPITGDVPQNPNIPPSLQLEIQKISNKYNIFT